MNFLCMCNAGRQREDGSGGSVVGRGGSAGEPEQLDTKGLGSCYSPSSVVPFSHSIPDTLSPIYMLHV